MAVHWQSLAEEEIGIDLVASSRLEDRLVRVRSEGSAGSWRPRLGPQRARGWTSGLVHQLQGPTIGGKAEKEIQKIIRIFTIKYQKLKHALLFVKKNESK